MSDRCFAGMPDLDDAVDNNGQLAVRTRKSFFDKLNALMPSAAPDSTNETDRITSPELESGSAPRIER